MERITILFLFVAAAQGHSCRICDKSSCDTPTNCPGGITHDACRCCLICARQEGESCGGWYGNSGTCDSGLKCVTPVSPGHLPSGQEVGTCKPLGWESESDRCKKMYFQGCDVIEEICKCAVLRACTNPFRFPDETQCSNHARAIANSKQNCSNHRCEVRYSPNCPSDSESEPSRWPAGECCPLPSKCRCRRNACKPKICPRDHDLVLVKSATGEPGSCCDYYKCKPQEYDCGSVHCPNYDQNITCPADSMKVTDRMAKDGCCMLPPKCRCKSIVCTETSCPDGSRALVLVQGNGRSGTCCDEIRCVKIKPEGSCRFEGKIYMHGESFQRDPCVSCQCRNGVYHCAKQRCPVLGCASHYIPEGRCCPRCRLIIQKPPVTFLPQRVCTDFVGEVHLPGSVWFPDDCTRCVCEEDGPNCVASSCQKNCEHPRRVEGKCCGVCDEITAIRIPPVTCPSTLHCNLTGKECPFGFKSDQYGCSVCECRQKSDVCDDNSQCRLRCPNGYLVNELGCEICQCKKKGCRACAKQCPFGFRTEKNKCSRCKCRKCANIVATCTKKCKFGRVINKYGCKICKCRAPDEQKLSPKHPVTCSDEHASRDDGEEWKTTSGRLCVCRHGQVLCDMLECPIPHCEEPIVVKGAPCAICPDSPPVEVQGLQCSGRVDGETWEADSCTSCICISGRVMCTYEICKPAPCAKPVFKEDHCCPSCPETDGAALAKAQCVDVKGKTHQSGSSWRRDICTSCKCDAGIIRCFGETCPQEHDCLEPVVKRDQCCPQCLDDPQMNSCEVGGKNYTHGEIWSTSPDDCEFCSCVHGNTLCRRELCRPLADDCKRVIKREGECCSVCDETATATTTTFKMTSRIVISSTTSTVTPVEIGLAYNGTLPIAAGVGGTVVLLVLVAITAIYVFKRRKIAAKSTIYKAGSIRKSVTA